MSTKHTFTPGPWTVGIRDAYAYRIDAKQSDLDFAIAVTTCGGEKDQANARLIAAAPELLAALKDFTLRFEALEEKEAKGIKLYWREITAAGAYDSAKRAIARAEQHSSSLPPETS